MENRSITESEIEIRSVAGRQTITGYAATYGNKSKDLGGFVEIVQRGAFDNTLNDPNAEVVARIEHQSGLMVIGKRSNGSLKLESNATGLKYTITPPNTSAANDLIELLRTGLIDKSSFAFNVRKDGESWDFSGKVPVRTLLDVTLIDIAPVSNPAYSQTSVKLRTFEDAKTANNWARINKLKAK